MDVAGAALCDPAMALASCKESVFTLPAVSVPTTAGSRVGALPSVKTRTAPAPVMAMTPGVAIRLYLAGPVEVANVAAVPLMAKLADDNDRRRVTGSFVNEPAIT